MGLFALALGARKFLAKLAEAELDKARLKELVAP
jgi:hypothetical protein